MQYEKRKIRIVAGIHGNEKGPVRAIRDSKIPFILGNPCAYKKDVREIEQDLNASFGTKNKTYESLRARELLKKISAKDIVVDFHSTSAKTPAFVIVTDLSLLPFAKQTGLSKAVLMSYNIKKGHALINHRDGISIETSGYNSQKSYRATLAVLLNLQKTKPVQKPITIYEVYGKITRKGIYKNFVYHRDGFYPVLAGGKSYDFFGLKARKLEKITA